MAQGRYYTTQQLAQLLGVTIPTVVNWIKQGRLAAHKTPGGHRRVSHDALERFSSQYEYPLPGAPVTVGKSGKSRILIIDSERDFSDMVGEYLELKGHFDVRTAADALEAGFHLGNFQPHLVLLDLEVDRVGALDIVLLQKSVQAPQTVRIVCTTTFLGDLPTERVKELGISRVLEKPVKLDLVLETISAVLA